MADGLLDQERQRGVVVDVDAAADFGQRTAVAVIGVFAEAQVGDHQELGRDSPGDPDRLLDDAVIARGGRAACVFVLRDSEQEDRRDAQLGRFGDRFAEPVERELVLAGHRRDFTPEVLAVIDEKRIDQVVDGKTRFADQVAQSRMTAEAAWPMKRITGRRAGRSWRRFPAMPKASDESTSNGRARPIVACRSIAGQHRARHGTRRSIRAVSARVCG